MLLITPLIKELELRYKGAEIDIVAEGGLATEIFSTFFSVKNVYCLPRRGFKHPARFLSVIFRIRKTPYDLIIDPCLGSNFSRTLTRIFKGRFKLGFSDSTAPPGLTHAVPTSSAPRHMAKRPVYLARWHSPLSVSEPSSVPAMDIRLTDEERRHGQTVIRQLLGTLPPSARKVGIYADATGRKRYPTAWWDEFITALKQWAPDANLVEVLPMHGKSMLGSTLPAYYSSSIRRMAAVMSNLDLIISADCGVMHLAACSQVPTIGLFMATDVSVYEPYHGSNSGLTTVGLSASDAALRVVETHPFLSEPPRETGKIASHMLGSKLASQ